MKYIYIVILSAFMLITSATPKYREETEVTVLNSKGLLKKYIYHKERKVALVRGRRRIPISRQQVEYNKMFFRQLENMETLYGIKIKYPELIYDDVCILSDILSDHDVAEVNALTHISGNVKNINLMHINMYYTYLSQRVDYVFFLKILVENDKLKEYEYKCITDFSGEIENHKHSYQYDNLGRIIQITNICNDEKEVLSIQYH
jgi:hypothetical protein